MHIDYARELKFQLLGTTLPKVKGDILAAQPIRGVDRIQRAIALGVTPHRRNQFRLALRIQQRGAEQSDAVEAIRKKTKGEVDVRYVGRVARQAPWRQSRQRPLRIGTSVGHYLITAGTIACFVRINRTGEIALLSNNHVLANENDGRVGDAILQPGLADGGRKGKDVAAKLKRFVRLKKTGRNQVDAAIAELPKAMRFDPAAIRGSGNLAGVIEADVAEYDHVEKLGRTTGHTEGRISAIELDNLVVAYDMGNLTFDDQIEIESSTADPFSQGGDSGSLIFTSEGNLALGLLFAGSDQGGNNNVGLTYANPVPTVLRLLKAELVLDDHGDGD